VPTGQPDAAAAGVPQQASISFGVIAGLVVAIAATDAAIKVIDAEALESLLKLFVAGASLVWARRAGLSWSDLGLGRANVGEGLRLGGLIALVIGVAIALLVAIPGSRGYFEASEVAGDSGLQHVLEPLLYIPLGTVLFEELLFRGVLLGALLQTSLTRVGAILVSSVIFALWHLPSAVSDASGNGAFEGVGIIAGTLVSTAAAGVLFAYVRVRSGSLIAPIFAHIATNSFSYLGATVALEL
jgi:membrane protease YdiL (CAAX protease family)